MDILNEVFSQLAGLGPEVMVAFIVIVFGYVLRKLALHLPHENHRSASFIGVLLRSLS